ncbi:LacI family transcriptional regulator [Brevibacterium sp. R8603A2]|uniref:LacI family DNA-binding transcriptional regulator n=1 Tax=Brevibacterium sp. R8603A2 TaxID=2929779 RepID=UPI001FFA85AF|nr:LacI family DNA-binding transcriptional regulator [Brevibacterium sp. R8603A2]MCK1802607.1 LacI family transcriptional regulator [Brevibacterium sp. R8603A2]
MGARSGRATLADVAQAAGVSASAVSMVMNDRTGLTQATRLRILAAARAVGYPVRGRAGREGRVLGVLPTDLGNPYHTDVITGIEKHAESVGAAVVIGHGRRDSAHLERQLDRMLGFGVDGIVAVTTWLRPAALEDAATVLPVAVIGRMQDPATGVDMVRGDDAAGAAQAVRHLVRLGHTRLVHVTMSTRPGPAARRAGFLAEAARLGLEGQARVIGPAADWAAMEEQIDAFLERIRAGRSTAPTAVFAANDIAAVRVMHRAAALGVRVPQQLSVVGYDSSAAALMIRPHLTSVNQPREEMGRLAAGMVLERLAGRASDAELIVRPVLRERESSTWHPDADRETANQTGDAANPTGDAADPPGTGPNRSADPAAASG